MENTIRVTDLLPGDVLLYRGTSFVSRAIQFFDGSDLSHAGLYLGDGKVGEAVARGLVRSEIQDSVHGNEWVKAYRLKDRPTDVRPLLDRAQAYLDQGNRYGYEQLLLLALLCLTRKLKVTPSLGLLIRRVLDAAASTLTRFLSQDREPMICSEFVFRAHDEALPGVDDPFSLRLNELVRALLRRMPGMTPRAEMPLTIPKGQGIHPESLLAFLSSESSSIWLGAPAGPAPRAGPPAPAVDESELEALVIGYLEEARAVPAPATGTPRAIPEGPRVEELHAAAERFASTLYAASRGAEARTERAPRDMGARAPSTGRSLINDYLPGIAADFVTPADLYRTQSLFPLGQIEL